MIRLYTEYKEALEKAQSMGFRIIEWDRNFRQIRCHVRRANDGPESVNIPSKKRSIWAGKRGMFDPAETSIKTEMIEVLAGEK